MSDAGAAARVVHRAETRSENSAANGYVPTDAELDAYRAAKNHWGQSNLEVTPFAKYVTGDSKLVKPSTDELVQWAAHKWGIPVDLMRAQMAVESWWRQPAANDRKLVTAEWYSLYPEQARVVGTGEVLQSMGVMQIKWTPDGGVGAGTEPLRWKSTAFNLDHYGATIRYYHDGHCSWCTNGYGAGQAWHSIGAWYSPHPWGNSDAQAYVGRVKDYLADRVWAKPGF